MPIRTKLFLMLTLFLLSCTEEPGERQYTEGTLPAIPVNLADINTKYDEYNSAGSSVGTVFPLCFSTNRNSEGADFDIVYKLLEIWFNLIDGSLSFGEFKMTNWVYYENYTLTNALKKINTSGNEYGPYLGEMGTVEGKSTGINTGNYQSYVLMYSTNITGNQNIYYLHNLDSEEFNQS